MTRFLLVLLMSCLIFACKPGIPKEVIQPAEMEKILHDIHIVDGYVTNIPTADSAKKVSSPLYKGIFKKYGVDSATHAKSMDYYYHRPDLLTKMYDNITARIEKEKVAEANKQQKSTTPEVAKELKN